MSTSIENQVVKLTFDNADFKKNAGESISLLDKLKSALNFKGSAAGLQEVSGAAKSVNLEPIGRSVDAVKVKFSALQVAAIAAITGITSKAMMAGKQMVDSFGADQMKAGFAEYELNMKSIQTILANTQRHGTSLEEVNKALDSLNDYADTTVYNFGQMTDAVGKFTLAGIDVDQAQVSVRGFANASAMAGADATSMSGALQQLSQSLSSGKVQLQDWMSLETRGIATLGFQEEIIKTAKQHGVQVDKMIKKNGSFRLSLQEGWLSTDIMQETLAKYSGAMDDSYWKTKGYSDKQIAEINKLAKTAGSSAQDIKTWSDMVGGLREQTGSAWGLTFRTVIGDFEESKDLFTGMNAELEKILFASHKARNEMLGVWKEAGGRDDVVAGLKNIYNFFKSIVIPMKQAWESVFPPKSAEGLILFSKKFKEFTERLKVGNGTLKFLTTLVKMVANTFKVLSLVIGAVVAVAVKLIKFLATSTSGLVRLAASIYNLVMGFMKMTGELGVIQKLIGGLVGMFQMVFGPALAVINNVANALADLINGDVSTFKEAITNAFAPFGEVGKQIGDVLAAMGGGFASFGRGVAKVGNEIALLAAVFSKNKTAMLNHMGAMKDSILPMDKLAPMAQKLGNAIQKLRKAFRGNEVEEFSDKTEVIAKNGDTAAGAWQQVVTIFTAVKNAVGPVMAVVGSVLGWIKDRITRFMDTVDMGDALALINTGILIQVLKSARTYMDEISNTFKAGQETLMSMAGLFQSFGGVVSSMEKDIKSTALLKISIAIAILVGTLYLLTLIDPKKGGEAVTTMVLMMGMLVAMMGAIDKAVNSENLAKMPLVAFSLIMLGAALMQIATAVKIMGNMETGALVKGATTVMVMMTALVAAATVVSKHAEKIGIAALSFTSLSISIIILAGAVMLYAALPAAKVVEGAVLIGLVVAILGAAMKALPNEKVAGMIALSVAVIALAVAFKMLEEIDGPKLLVIAAAISLILLAAGKAMEVMQKASAGIVGMLSFAAAILMISNALSILGAMSWASIITGIGVMLVFIAIMTGVALLVSALAPAFTTFAGVMMVLGIAIALLGAGTLALGIGFGMIAAGAAAAGVAFVAFAYTVMQAIPLLAQQFAVMVKSLLKILEGMAADITDTILAIAMYVLDGLGPLLEKLIDVVITFIEDLVLRIMEMMPLLIEAGTQMIQSILDGIASNIGGIVESATNIITNFLGALGESAAEIADAGMKLIIDLINAMADALSNNTPALDSAMRNLGEAAMKAIETVFLGIGSIAGDLVKGLVNGIKNGIGAVGQAAKDLGNSALNKIKSILRINSPSKEMEQIGKWFNEGFIKGIRSGEKTVVKEAFNDMKAQLLELRKDTKKNVEDEEKALKRLRAAKKKDRKEIAKQEKELKKARAEQKAANKAYEKYMANRARWEKKAIDNATKLTSVNEKLNKKIEERDQMVSDRNSWREQLKDQYASLPVFEGGETITKEVNAATEAFNEFTSQLDSATTKMDTAKQAMDDMNKSLTDTYNAVPTVDENTTFSSYVEQMEKSIEDNKKMYELLQTLRSMGLDDASYQKLSQDGVKALPFMQDLINGGPEAIANMNALTKDLEQSASNIGGAVSDALLSDEYESALDEYNKLAAKKEAEQAKLDKADDDLFGAYKKDLAAQTKANNQFLSDMTKLRAMGLNDEMYEKLMNEGPAQQAFVTSLLAAGKSGVTEVNKLNKDLMASASKVGDTASKAMYQNGIDAANGFIAGLTKQKQQLEAIGKTLADTIVAAIKKSLQIKSPSRVMMGMGKFTAEGLANGIASNAGLVSDATKAMGGEMVDSLAKAVDEAMSVVDLSDTSMQPVIRPVLDLSDVESGAAGIGGLFTNPVAVGRSSQMANAVINERDYMARATALLDAQRNTEKSVVFNQYNTSPKSLDAITIYRRTSNQLNRSRGVTP